MKIEFNRENIEKCLCIKCKVQSKSQCIKDKVILLQEKALSSALVEPKEFPSLHCASGKEQCNDLHVKENCMCLDCPIWKDNELEYGAPGYYFCIDGPSTRCTSVEGNEDAGEVAEMLRNYYIRRD